MSVHAMEYQKKGVGGGVMVAVQTIHPGADAVIPLPKLPSMVR